MANGERVTTRQRAILMAIVESYIDTGEPVGSATVVEKLARSHGEGVGFSAATVRNEMAELADAGLLEQPHTCDPRLDWLYDQIAELNELDRSLTLLLLDGFSYSDMASLLGIGESNVGVRINRIKARLIKQAGQEGIS